MLDTRSEIKDGAEIRYGATACDHSAALKEHGK
jgi:hypothetical protein